MTASPSLDPQRLDVISSEHYEQNGYPFAEWAWLRKHDPVRWIEHPEYEPFWAITKHADLIELSKQPRLFLNQPRLAVFNKNVPPPPEGSSRHLLVMDPPDHAKYRNVASKWFTPRTVRGLQAKVERITPEVIDDAARSEGGDFVRDISARITIAVIAEMLGVPRPDWDPLFRWTNEVIAPVIQFCRTATRDYELRDKTIRAGESACLFYASANRDEEVFADPEVFRIDRIPNRHLGFGVGEHVCLGAHLARLELRCVLDQLSKRLVQAEQSGPVERARSSFVGGIKRAPMHWRIEAA